MRLKQITVSGFRGFNESQTISFHDRLTLISAPNSHGKTSITEALEYLLYGETSKVAQADSKEEYKDSYLNRHYPSNQAAWIEAVCEDENGAMTLRVEFDALGVRRQLNGKAVDEWPFAPQLVSSAKPFVVQHALKRLLLAAPAQRFEGFAKLLGLNDVDSIQQSIVNLCTKPEAHLSPKAKSSLADLQAMEARMAALPELQPLSKDLKRGISGVSQAFKKADVRIGKLLGTQPKPEEAVGALTAARAEAAAKVYSGTIAIAPLTASDQTRFASARDKIVNRTGAPFLEGYARLAVRDTTERLQSQANMLQLGIDLLASDRDKCPLCGQEVNDSIRAHIEERHADLETRLGSKISSPDLRAQIGRDLSELLISIHEHQKLLAGRSKSLLTSAETENESRVEALLGASNAPAMEMVRAALKKLSPDHEAVLVAVSEITSALDICKKDIKGREEDLSHAETLTRAVQSYLAVVDSLNKKLDDVSPTLVGPARLLEQAVDALAGTTELTVLIDLLEKRSLLERSMRLRSFLESLKELKKHVEQTVGETMENAFSLELTGAVMGWYDKIRTSGDPDVHFSGFGMERTKGGDFKSRRVKVAAKSYGVDLASAVSSLSESKLNALGLCMSISTAVTAPGPWDFIVLDDPIQSWDEEHEIQFIDVIRSLVEQENKQLLLLSHRDSWIDQVSAGCRSLNGLRYRISGYTKGGPHIQQMEWAAVDQRLKEALMIANDPTASTVRLQQAEEEIRIASCQLASDVAKKKLNRQTSPNNFNQQNIRSILTEASCPAALTDRVVATFETTDDAHHAPKRYQPNAERIRQYHSALIDLKKWLSE